MDVKRIQKLKRSYNCLKEIYNDHLFDIEKRQYIKKCMEVIEDLILDEEFLEEECVSSKFNGTATGIVLE
jgi:hypothetical protein